VMCNLAILWPHMTKKHAVFSFKKKSRVGKVGILNYIPGNNLNIAIASPTTTLPWWLVYCIYQLTWLWVAPTAPVGPPSMINNHQ
jgi:hypothetical protein